MDEATWDRPCSRFLLRTLVDSLAVGLRHLSRRTNFEYSEALPLLASDGGDVAFPAELNPSPWRRHGDRQRSSPSVSGRGGHWVVGAAPSSSACARASPRLRTADAPLRFSVTEMIRQATAPDAEDEWTSERGDHQHRAPAGHRPDPPDEPRKATCFLVGRSGGSAEHPPPHRVPALSRVGPRRLRVAARRAIQDLARSDGNRVLGPDRTRARRARNAGLVSSPPTRPARPRRHRRAALPRGSIWERGRTARLIWAVLVVQLTRPSVRGDRSRAARAG